MRFPGLAVVAVAALTLVGCNGAPPPPASPAPIASIQDLMLGLVDPAADVVWGSVAAFLDAHGETTRQPKTPEDWAAVRHAALTLTEAPNLLVMPGRRVARAGRSLSDSQAPGMLTADQIQAAVDADPAGFARLARALQDLGVKTLAAVDARDVAALTNVAGDIDDACETCHLRYWYPKPANPAAPPH